MKYVSV